jgi:hypothetical protein
VDRWTCGSLNTIYRYVDYNDSLRSSLLRKFIAYTHTYIYTYIHDVFKVVRTFLFGDCHTNKRGVAIKFRERCSYYAGKINEKYKEIKNCFIYEFIQRNLHLLEYIFVSFKKFLKIIRKNILRNSIQLGSHVFLNILTIPKHIPFERSF